MWGKKLLQFLGSCCHEGLGLFFSIVFFLFFSFFFLSADFHIWWSGVAVADPRQAAAMRDRGWLGNRGQEFLWECRFDSMSGDHQGGRKLSITIFRKKEKKDRQTIWKFTFYQSITYRGRCCRWGRTRWSPRSRWRRSPPGWRRGSTSSPETKKLFIMELDFSVTVSNKEPATSLNPQNWLTWLF